VAVAAVAATVVVTAVVVTKLLPEP